MNDIIKIKNLNKTYKNNLKALNNINLNIKAGTIHGLLGPNGAGKSTLINIMHSLVIKDSGSIQVNGIDIDNNLTEFKKNIGIVPQDIYFDPFFTVYDAVKLQSGYFGIENNHEYICELLKKLHLWEKRTSKPRQLSGGMKRRILIAKALVHKPAVVILDEPTAGVDIELRQHLWDLVRELNQNGVTIVITTHYLEEAEELCDDITIINKGNIISSMPKQELLKSSCKKIMIIKTDNQIDFDNIELNENIKIQSNNFEIKIEYNVNDFTDGDIINILFQNGIKILSINTKTPSLEEVFLELTSNE